MAGQEGGGGSPRAVIAGQLVSLQHKQTKSKRHCSAGADASSMAMSSLISGQWGWRPALDAQVGAGDTPGACAAGKLERGLMQKADT